MRRIERTTQFKKDYKRESRGRYKTVVESALIEVVGLLVLDLELPERYFDHSLAGQWKDFRDYHIKHDPASLRLARIGSHSELSL
ncbi:type II toxin-antitoxin system YafQ family toxin [Polynucleobacter arcticus]|uniref:Type II toxin-antitoxin system mRNA interferase toxin, RelE/StbE family n=1 Tax=Polynucleobacter arcticus TaxID=1743165 RepID=A0A6M9PNE3_9BURK|nr:type II toxin-antitoxin system YafQ family toxin [Polynucleobacter arcticus]QKM60317.1 type II toxin-antitoxin system mRNA interferase toxin, RelE/StbE family [Polynucleobacter arcticus]